MGAATSINLQSSSKPERRLRSFRAYNIMFGCLVIMILYMLLKDLNRLPFPAAFALAAAVISLLRLWQVAANRYESISILLTTKRETPLEKSLDAALSACAKAIETGSFVIFIVIFMFLTTISQILSAH